MNTKPWFQSKTIWANVVAGIAFALRLAGIDIASDSPQIVDGLLNVVSFGALVFSIIGRIRASHVIAPAVKNINVAVAALILPALFFTGCAQKPTVVAGSPAAVVGEDLVAAASRATEAFAAYQNGNVDYAWAVSYALNAYRDIVKDAADVKALVSAWTAGKGLSFGDRLATLFNTSSGTPAEKMSALAQAVETAAAHPPLVVSP